MAQVAVAMLYVDKVKTSLGCDDCGVMKVFNYLLQLTICEHRIFGSDTETTIQDRMVIQDFWLGTSVRIWTTVAAGVRELQTYQKPFIGTGCLLVGGD